MMTRLYAHNFRCLVAFEAKFESFGVLCGPNGAGKSTVFDVIVMLRKLATGEALLGGEGERDIHSLDFTPWLDSRIQEFEIDLDMDGQAFSYLIHLEQVSSDLKPRVRREQATCNQRLLFERDLDGVKFQKPGGPSSGFPLDWRQAALGSIQPSGDWREIELLQHALAEMVVVRPSPPEIEAVSKGEIRSPSLHMENLLSWYRYLSQEQEWMDALRESLQDVWPDFRSFKLVDIGGTHAKILQLRFDGPGGRNGGSLFFHQLADGEKALVGLYMVRAALATGAVQTVLLDEPDNYVGLPELQPWVLALRELLDERHQAILISHHPEILGNAGEEYGRYLWRENHSSPTRIGPLKAPPGLSPGEAVARGWIHG
jgi:energy-coupling factor transporter ATP-binding protein EcfA2